MNPNAGTSGTKVYWDTRIGKIEEHPELFLGGFPLDGFRSVTPTLILVGGERNKGAIPALSSEILFSLLRRKGVPAPMLRYTDEGHGLTATATVRHAFSEVARWFETRLDVAVDAHGASIFDRARVRARSDTSELTP